VTTPVKTQVHDESRGNGTVTHQRTGENTGENTGALIHAATAYSQIGAPVTALESNCHTREPLGEAVTVARRRPNR